VRASCRSVLLPRQQTRPHAAPSAGVWPGRQSTVPSLTRPCTHSTAHRVGHRRTASTPLEELAREQYGQDGWGSVKSEEMHEQLVHSASQPGDPTSELDPKKAKRILANRLSAARSKERKAKHFQELERRVGDLQADLQATVQQAALVEQQTHQLALERAMLEQHVAALERATAPR